MNTLIEIAQKILSLHPLVPDALALAVKVLFMLIVVLSVGAVLSWVERKQSAIMQDRLGANRASIFGFRIIGLFHIISDAIKGLTKEDYVPPKANKWLHHSAPLIACFTGLACFAVMPFGDSVRIPGFPLPVELTVVPMEVSLLFVFAMLSLGIYGVIIAGYVSDNKYSMLGAMRATAQVISYEVTLGLTLMGVLLIFHSLNFKEIINAQNSFRWFGWFPFLKWGVFLQPLGFLLFLTAAVAETKRIPFDLPEGESEIIGYSVEFSGMKFLLFMMAEFIETLLFAWMIAAMFFAGWHLPGLHLVDGGVSGFYFKGQVLWQIPFWIVAAIQAAVFTVKICFFIFLLLQIRWTLPRFRYDQLMKLGWKIMLPLALANVMVTAAVAYWLR